MPFYIKVSNLDNNAVWETQLTSKEYERVKDYIKGKSTVAIFPATLKPIRTNNLTNFTKDFFLPTTLNHATKVHHVVGKVFAILGSLFLDSLTFPIRLLTCIPRIISNAREEENIFRKYLIGRAVDEKILAADHVRVKLGWECQSEVPVNHKYSQEQHWREVNVNFIEVPTYENEDFLDSGHNTI
jgi:hypothetical protein